VDVWLYVLSSHCSGRADVALRKNLAGRFQYDVAFCIPGSPAITLLITALNFSIAIAFAPLRVAAAFCWISLPVLMVLRCKTAAVVVFCRQMS
jgi:hypothetical protein